MPARADAEAGVQADGHMGKDSGWNLLSSDRLAPKAAPNKDAAWEASGVFSPTSMASAARHTPASRDRSASPTGHLSTHVPSHTTAGFASCALRAQASPASNQCALRRPQRAELRSTFSKGCARQAYSEIRLFSSSQQRNAIVAASTRDGYRWGVATTRTRKSQQINHAKTSQSSERLQSPITYLRLSLLKIANTPWLLRQSLLKIATMLAAIFIACASPCAAFQVAFRGDKTSPSTPPAATSSATDAAGRGPVKGEALIIGICYGFVLGSYAVGRGISILSTGKQNNNRRATGEMSLLT